MVWAALALTGTALCLRFSTDLVKAAVAALLIRAVLCATEQHEAGADATGASSEQNPGSIGLFLTQSLGPMASVQQGFQCFPASDLPTADILAFVQGLQNGTAELSSAQLSCLARLLAAKNLTADFSRYPPDLLLFFNLTKVPDGTCSAFYARASHGNLDLLPRGSAQRTGLLRGALACLGVRSSQLSPEQLGSLGALVCDMGAGTIAASAPGILENLKLCSALTEAQRDALNAVLLGRGTVYGDPSSWDVQTLQNLGPLLLALNQTTLSLVPKAALEAFSRSIVAVYGSQGRSQREKTLTLLKAFAAVSGSSHPRLRRSTDRCLSSPITASDISDSLLLISYDTSEQFDLCLSNEVLQANLGPLLEQPLTNDYLWVVKKKLEQIYPSGIPEEQLRLLGSLSRLYTAEEISQWPVTSSDTLSALLNPSDGKWEPAQIQQLLSRYLALGGTLTGPLLRKIGGRHLCDLKEEQIKQIPPEAIGTAGQLDISSCSQAKKDQLYRKAHEAFAGQNGTTRAYYCRIWPYLGGALAEDLKDLAKAGVAIDMDMDTFLALNPEELQKLSVMDVKNLLGENLPYLKDTENETSVMRWVERQSQQELDCVLGIGLQGGKEEPTGTATPPHPTATPTATTPAPTALPTVPTPRAISSLTTTNSSTSPPKAPTPSTISLTPPNNTPPRTYTAAPGAAVSPTAAATTRPAPTTGSIIPCSIHQPATSNKATPPAVTLLTTILATVLPNATSPHSIPPPALTHRATTSTRAVTNPAVTTRNASTPPVSTTPPTPRGSTHPTPATPNTTAPSTHRAPSTLVPNPTSPRTAATETNLPPHKPTPNPNSTISTQESIIPSTAKTTTLPCKTGAPPAIHGPSSTTTSSETTKKNPAGMPEPPRPTPGGYINLQPEAGSGSRLSSCLVHILAAAVGSSLLRGLL